MPYTAKLLARNFCCAQMDSALSTQQFTAREVPSDPKMLALASTLVEHTQRGKVLAISSQCVCSSRPTSLEAPEAYCNTMLPGTRSLLTPTLGSAV